MFVFMISVSSLISVMMILLSIIISLVSLSLLGLWVGMEINFLSAVCYMSGMSVVEGDSIMKYFIVQVVGSCFMVLGILMLINWSFLSIMNLLVALGILLKLGCFPFHWWVPSVMMGLSWSGCFILSVVQKIIPLWLLSNLSFSSEEVSLVEMLGCASCVVGCLGGLGVLSYRALLGYSSLVHVGFLILLSCVGFNLFWAYLFLYGILNFFLMGSLSSMGVYSFGDLMKEGELKKVDNLWWISLYFLSLAGLPPLTGAAMKIYFLVVCWNLMPLGSAICLVSSAVSLYFYLSMMFGMIIFWGKSLSKFSAEEFKVMSKISIISLLTNLIMGFCCFLSVGLI